MTRQLINLSDLLFQLAGVIGIFAILLGLHAEGQRRGPSVAAATLSGLCAALAAGALLAGAAAVQLHKRRRPTSPLN